MIDMPGGLAACVRAKPALIRWITSQYGAGVYRTSEWADRNFQAKRQGYTMQEIEYLARWPWIDPTCGYPDDTPSAGVRKVDGYHVAVSEGASHKSLHFMKIYPATDLERVNDRDWDLFIVSHEGTVNGVEYLWGAFMLGLGWFNVMVVKEHTRPLTDLERAAWAKKRLGMFGSHSGNLSYTMASGVSPNPEN